jgi:hypothetical protein
MHIFLLVVGLDSTKFSVQIHHGGYFVKYEQDISYVNEKSTVWFDNLGRNSFDMDTLDWMMAQLGYKKRKFLLWTHQEEH